MRAMILAAGKGERMGELTKNFPKPLLPVAGKYLIEYSIENLVQAGITEIIINVSYCAQQITQTLGDGKRYGAKFFYSYEETPLETGGGILQALPMLGKDPFIVISSDIISNYNLRRLPTLPAGLAHLVLVDNPDFKPQGDFGLNKKGWLDFTSHPTLTFANIGIYRPELFTHCQPGYFPLNKLLFPAIKAQQITGEHFKKQWHNVGSPRELQAARLALADLS